MEGSKELELGLRGIWLPLAEDGGLNEEDICRKSHTQRQAVKTDTNQDREINPNI